MPYSFSILYFTRPKAKKNKWFTYYTQPISSKTEVRCQSSAQPTELDRLLTFGSPVNIINTL